MDQIAIRLDEARRGEFRRFLVASGVLHVILFGVMAWSPAIPNVSPPAAITIDLTMAIPSPATKPGPAPSAKPKPKPRKAPVILPTQPSTPKPRAKPKPEPKPPVEEDEPKEVEYEDLMAQLRADAGEPDPSAEPEPKPVQTATAGGGGGGGPGLPIPPELAAWMRNARIHVRRSWVVPPAFEMESLVVEIRIELDASGNVRGTPKVARRSGNPWYDENVVRSIEKASPLPAPPEAGSWTFIFYSDREA